MGHVPPPGDSFVHGHVGGEEVGGAGARGPVAPAHGVVGEEGVVGHQDLGLDHQGAALPLPLLPPGLVDPVQRVSVEAVSVGGHDLLHQLLVVGDSHISTNSRYILCCILSSSAVIKRSIDSTIGFHNHREGPY